VSAKKPSVDSDICPNCNAEVTVPKSTRSFICKSCDAILKVFATEDGVEMKVVGKSVEDDPTYQQFEDQVAKLKADLDGLHARYEAEALEPIDPSARRIAMLGMLAVVAGVVVVFWSPGVGAGIAGAGAALAVVGLLVNSARKRAKVAQLAELSKTIAAAAARRDELQRSAAMLRVKST
jgi:hypothetical protein